MLALDRLQNDKRFVDASKLAVPYAEPVLSGNVAALRILLKAFSKLFNEVGVCLIKTCERNEQLDQIARREFECVPRARAN